MINIALLINDGDGDVAEHVIQHFDQFADVRVNLIILRQENESVRIKLRRYNIKTEVTDRYIDIDKYFTENEIHYIVLDKWIEQIPPNFCKKYQGNIINYHNAIYPNYVGDYFKEGDNIYTAALKDEIIGMSVYVVNTDNDNGFVLYSHKQKNIGYQLEELKSKIHEHVLYFYPRIIEKLIKVTNKIVKK